jgi:hypothetical protein
MRLQERQPLSFEVVHLKHPEAGKGRRIKCSNIVRRVFSGEPKYAADCNETASNYVQAVRRRRWIRGEHARDVKFPFRRETF